MCCAVLSRSVVSDSATPWTAARHARLSMGFPRQEYWSGLPCPLPGDPPNPGSNPRSPALQADFLPCEPPGKPKNIEVGKLSLLQGIIPNPGIEPGSPALQADSLPAELPEKPNFHLIYVQIMIDSEFRGCWNNDYECSILVFSPYNVLV